MLTPQINELVYSTYLGGNNTDWCYDMAIDSYNNLYITGETEFTDFPIKNPYQGNLSGSADAFITKLTPEAFLKISDIVPIQVVKDVDLVLGKRTLVRTEIDYFEGNGTVKHNATVTIYLNGTFNHTETQQLEEGKHLDIFFIPDTPGQNMSITAEISSTVPGFDTTNITEWVNITKTRMFNITFVPIRTFGIHDGIPVNFDDSVDNSSIFINKTYPLSDSGLRTTKTQEMVDLVSFLGQSHNIFTLPVLAAEVQIAAFLSGNYHEKSVGIVKEGFFKDVLFAENFLGFAVWQNGSGLTSVIIEDRIVSGIAHEIAHTYELCDEYSDDQWTKNNCDGTTCPNGDINGDGQLDECPTKGCPTYSLEPITNKPDQTTFSNFMGGGDVRFYDEIGMKWITNDSFSSLLDSFSHESPVFAEKRLLISGMYNGIDKTAEFNPFYELGPGLAINTSEIFGNKTIELKNITDDIVFSLNFDISFIIYGNGTIDINETPFVFVIPFPENTKTINIIENNSIKDQVNVTSNKPNVTVISPNGGEFFSNDEINISWEAYDPDGDNLTYVVLFSSDNGMEFSTLIADLNKTSINVNSSVFPDSKNALIKILVTDGVNTGNDTSDSVFEIDNDLNITLFKVVYTNQTERIFEINLNNTLNTNITDISWNFYTGETTKSSIYKFNLKPSEQMFLYFYHNYSTSGNFTITLSAFNNNLLEVEYLNLEVI
ncbi:MAG: SBBP repeat-containing protein [Bacteroidota bacterium]